MCSGWREIRTRLGRQVRRAALSVPCNIVEGCARRTAKEYLQFVNIAVGSAAETRYLIDLGNRLEIIESSAATALCNRYDELLRKLQKLLHAIERM